MLSPCVILPFAFGFNPMLILQSQIIYVFGIPSFGNLYCMWESRHKCGNQQLETEFKTQKIVTLLQESLTVKGSMGQRQKPKGSL